LVIPDVAADIAIMTQRMDRYDYVWGNEMDEAFVIAAWPSIGTRADPVAGHTQKAQRRASGV
jgi:hypothetical protein